MSLVIYGTAASRAFRVLWAAEEIGIAYDRKPWHFKGPEIHGPEFLAINPNAAIPAITDDGVALFESLAINLYLARKHAKLWASTIADEGRIYQWTLYAASEVEPAMTQWSGHTSYLPEAERKPDLAVAAASRLEKRFAVLEGALSRSDALVGNAFGIADLNLASVLFRAPAFGLDRWPALKAWHARCYARPKARAMVALREQEAKA